MNAIDPRFAAAHLAALRHALQVRDGALFTRLTFSGGDDRGMDAAARWLEDNGFSVGSHDAGHGKRGVMHGSWLIPAWGELRATDLAQLDGRVEDHGDAVVVEILPDAAPQAIAAAQDRWAA